MSITKTIKNEYYDNNMNIQIELILIQIQKWISTILHEFWVQIYIYFIDTHTYIEISNLFL